MRARNIKPGYYKNEDLAECSLEARFIFPGLWMIADCMGRLENRPKRIKGELLPFDNIDVTPLLDELEQWGLINRYEVDGSKYIWIPNFLKHQRPHQNESVSVLPRHPDDPYPEKEDQTRSIKNKCGEPKAEALATKVESTLHHSDKHFALNPDSLNPDSLNPDSLNPDSLNPEVTTSCPTVQKNEPPDSRQEENGKEPPVLSIPLVSKDRKTGEPELYPVTQSQIDQLAELFPALDVPQALREIKAWNLANPKNRKTKAGIMKHITGWLSKEQNKAKSFARVRGQPMPGFQTIHDRNRQACEAFLRGDYE